MYTSSRVGVESSAPPSGGSGGSNSGSSNGEGGNAGSTSVPPRMPGDPTSLAACAEKARYVTDLTFIAGDRTPGSAAAAHTLAEA